MRLRTRLLVLSVSTVAAIVAVMFFLQLDSLTAFWLNSASERSNLAGAEIQSLLAMRLSESPASAAATGLAQTKRIWNRIVAGDRSIADALIKQTALPSGAIVEINIVGEDGNVLVSSIPSRQGQPAPVRDSLQSILDSGPLKRLSAITTATADWETRIPLGIGDRTKPVFEIQLLVSSILLRDKLLPDLKHTALFALLALFAAVALAVVSSRLALRPVRRIGSAIDTLATGKPLGLSLPDGDADDREVAAVEYKLSLLGEQMQGARRDADQMRTAIGSLARGVAHEIKNPLNAIALRLEALRFRIAEEVPEAEAEIDLVSNEVQRLDRVVRTFLDLNRPMELNIEEFDAAGMAAMVVEIVRPAAVQANVELRLTAPDGVVVRGDRGLLEQGLLNILNNALQALGSKAAIHTTPDRPTLHTNATPPVPGAGSIQVSVLRDANNCVISVADNGPGMPPNIRDRIFEPYFTTKSSGSGIGLAFTKRAVDLHGGHITADSAPGAGTTMTMSFPTSGRKK